jgi:uncharacterized protein (DUF302 family)
VVAKLRRRDRLAHQARCRQEGHPVVGVIDQAKLGNAAGNSVPPSRLVMFGNPALGTTFITANPTAGLDWPVRVLVYQTQDGAVYAATPISIGSPAATASRPVTRSWRWPRR